MILGIPKTGRNVKKTGRRVGVLKTGRLPGKRVDLASLMPLVTGFHVELAPFMYTCCTRYDKKAFIQ